MLNVGFEVFDITLKGFSAGVCYVAGGSGFFSDKGFFDNNVVGRRQFVELHAEIPSSRIGLLF